MTSTSSGPPASIPVSDIRLVGLVRSMRSGYSVTIEFRPASWLTPRHTAPSGSGPVFSRVASSRCLAWAVAWPAACWAVAVAWVAAALALPIQSSSWALDFRDLNMPLIFALAVAALVVPGDGGAVDGSAEAGPGGGGGGGASGTATQNSHPSGAAGHEGSGRQSLPGVKPSATCHPGGGLNRYAITAPPIPVDRNVISPIPTVRAHPEVVGPGRVTHERWRPSPCRLGPQYGRQVARREESDLTRGRAAPLHGPRSSPTGDRPPQPTSRLRTSGRPRRSSVSTWPDWTGPG